MVLIHRHISNLRLDLSVCRPYSALLSTEVLCAAPSELGISRHFACAVGTPQELTGNISPSGEKPYKVFCRSKANYEWMFYLQSDIMVKKDIEMVRASD